MPYVRHVQSDHKKRRGLGGSQVAAALGLNPFKPPIVLWQELQGTLETPSNDAMTWGLAIEPSILHYYAWKNPSVTLGSQNITFYRHEWQRHTPDAIAMTRHNVTLEALRWGVEAKNCGYRGRFGLPGTDEVPIEYWMQCQWGCLVLGLERFVLVACVEGSPPVEYNIEFDRETTLRTEELAGEWWERHYVKGDEPSIDDSLEYRQYIARRYPWSKEDLLPSTARIEERALELQRVLQNIKELESRRQHLINEVCQFIGEYSGVTTSIGRLTYKMRKGGIEWKALATHLWQQQHGNKAGLTTFSEQYRLPSNRVFNRPNKWTQS